MTAALLDADQIRQAWSILIEPGALTEIRVIDGVDRPQGRPGIHFGYFSDPEAVITALSRLHSWAGVYIIPSPVDPILASRGNGRLQWGKRGGTTTDADILRRRWILIDVDAKRRGSNGQEIKDIPSTDAEHAATAATAADITGWLATLGWPEPVVCSSGNGTHVVYRCELPTKTDLPQKLLQALARRFDSDAVSVDQAVFNPARIWRLPGTRACKGGVSTDDRPWRMARVLSAPETCLPVSEAALQAVMDSEPAPAPASSTAPPAPAYAGQAPTPGADFDPIALLAAAGLTVSHTKQLSEGGTSHILQTCPCDRGLCDGTSSLTIAASGAVGLTCMHASCEYSRGARTPGESWRAFRALHDTSLGQRADREDTVARARALADSWPQTPPAVDVTGLVDHAPGTQPELPAAPTPASRTDAKGRVMVDTGADWQDQRDAVFGALASDDRIWLTNDALAVVGHQRRMIPLSARDGSLDSAIVDRCACVAWRVDTKTNAWVPKPASLNPRIVSMVAAHARDPAGRQRLREVVSITSSPVYSPDGELFAADGWSPKTRTLIVGCIPTELPASMSAAHSLDVLRSIYADYPFASSADLDNIIAALLVPLVRPMISGPIPFFAVQGNQQGVGKSKIPKTILSMHGLPHETTTWHQDRKDFADGLLVKLKRAIPVVVYDNIKHYLDSPEFENLLTTGVYADRLKGVSEDGQYEVRTLFCLTGNGMTMSRDMARRGMFCTIRDTSGEPGARQVTHEDLEGHVAQYRSAYLSHLLQMVQDWLAADRPRASYTDTTFTEFCHVVGGIIEHAGGQFWANAREARDDSRDDSEWGILLAEMNRRNTPLLPAEIVAICDQMSILGDVIGGGSPASQASKLGKALRKHTGAVLYGYRMDTQRDTRTQQVRYLAVSVEVAQPRSLYDAMH